MPESRPQSDMPADLPEPHWPQNMIQAPLTNDESSPEAELLDESLYATLFQRSGAGKALLDITGRIQLVNASLATLLGYAQDEITGLLLRDCFARLDQPLMQTTLEQLEQGRIESYQSEKSLMHKEGQALWVRLHLIRLTDPASGQPGLLLEIQDLTRQQQEETAWRDHHERLVLAERLSGVGYSSLDLATGYVYWSQAMYKIFGQTPGLFTPDLKAALEQCIHPEDAARVELTIQEVIRTHKPTYLRYRIIWPNHEVKLCENRLEILLDATGRPAQLLNYALDITTTVKQTQLLQQVNQALELQSRQLGQLAGLVDDVLISPLSGMEQLAARTGLAGLGASSRESLEQLDEISQDLHETRKLEFERLPISVEVACQRAMQMLEPDLTHRQVRFDLDFSAWSMIEYVPFYLDNLLYQLLRSTLLLLDTGRRWTIRLSSRYEPEAVQSLFYEVQGADLGTALQQPESGISQLKSQLESRGGKLDCLPGPEQVTALRLRL